MGGDVKTWGETGGGIAATHGLKLGGGNHSGEVKLKSTSDRPRFKVFQRPHSYRRLDFCPATQVFEVTFLWEHRSLGRSLSLNVLQSKRGAGAELEFPKAPCQDIIASHKASIGNNFPRRLNSVTVVLFHSGDTGHMPQRRPITCHDHDGCRLQCCTSRMVRK
jgi:hypothetical protein